MTMYMNHSSWQKNTLDKLDNKDLSVAHREYCGYRIVFASSLQKTSTQQKHRVNEYWKTSISNELPLIFPTSVDDVQSKHKPNQTKQKKTPEQTNLSEINIYLSPPLKTNA